MRTRFLLPFSAICIGLPVMVFLLPRLLLTRSLPDSIGQFEQWRPTPTDIQRAVGINTAGHFSDARHVQFAHMFQKRFRDNQKAVGVSFSSDDGIKAKFAATIPRWDMAAVALQLHREAKEVFGKNYNVD